MLGTDVGASRRVTAGAMHETTKVLCRKILMPVTGCCLENQALDSR
jgi:hypothetical protein